MAQNVTSWVWEHSRAVNGSLITLLAIASEANRHGEAEISAAELAAKCRLGERTVQTAVKELAAAGELLVRHGGGRGHQTRYQVPVVNPAESAPIPGSNPAESAPFEPETPQNLHPLQEPPGSETPQNLHPLRPIVAGQSETPQNLHPLPISDVFVSSTGMSEVPVKDVSAKLSTAQPRPDADRLCDYLAGRVEANGSKRPNITKRWRDSARLMLDADGHTEQQIMAAIDWSQNSEFWRANILSMPKLREKYDQLRLQAQRVPAANGTRPSAADRRVADAQQLKARMRRTT